MTHFSIYKHAQKSPVRKQKDVPNRNAEYKVGNKIIDLTNKFAKLGAWVAKIRTQFKLYQVNRASSYLDGDQVKYLRSIGKSQKFVV